MHRLRPTRTVLLLALLCASLSAQTLAKKNWAGSGITVEPWYQGAILYQLDPLTFQDSGAGASADGYGDLQGIIQRLDYLQTLGVDALLLSPFQLQPSPSPTPFDPKYGTEEDLDQLIQEASRRKIRIFVELPSRPTPELLSAARFWLTRGIAGLRLSTDPHSPPPSADTLRQLQHLCATFAGGRVLIADTLQPATSTLSYHRHHAVAPAPAQPAILQLTLDPRLSTLSHLDAASLRAALTPIPQPSTPVPLTDTPNHARSFDRLGNGISAVPLAKILATALLTSPGAPLLYFGQEIGMATTLSPPSTTPAPSPMQWGGEPGFTAGVPWVDMGANADSANVTLEDSDADSLLNWYRRLAALRHANASLRSGTLELLPITSAQANPDVVAWIRRVPPSATSAAPALILCNLTAHPVQLSIAADLRRLGLFIGSGILHTLASSTAQSAADQGLFSINNITLPPFGIYLGELPHQAAPEAPLVRRSRSRSARTSP